MKWRTLYAFSPQSLLQLATEIQGSCDMPTWFDKQGPFLTTKPVIFPVICLYYSKIASMIWQPWAISNHEACYFPVICCIIKMGINWVISILCIFPESWTISKLWGSTYSLSAYFFLLFIWWVLRYWLHYESSLRK